MSVNILSLPHIFRPPPPEVLQGLLSQSRWGGLRRNSRRRCHGTMRMFSTIESEGSATSQYWDDLGYQSICPNCYVNSLRTGKWRHLVRWFSQLFQMGGSFHSFLDVYQRVSCLTMAQNMITIDVPYTAIFVLRIVPVFNYIQQDIGF